MNDITQEIFGNQLYTVGKKSDTSKQVFTPTKVVDDMLDLLPAEIFNPDTTFIDIYCKSGIFLKRIYEKLDLALQKLEKFTNPEIRRNHILNNQIYGLVMDNSGSLLLCNKVIYGDAFHDGHLLYLDSVNVAGYSNYEDILHKMNPTKIKEKIEKMFNRQGLGFDVVVGNPPYNRGGDIDFVNLGYELCNKYTVMITPAKWQTAEANQRIDSQMSYGDFRKKIVPHMKEVVYYPNSLDIFEKVYQIDGITYFCIDKQQEIDKCTVCNVQSTIYDKVENILKSYENSEYVDRTIQNRQIINGETLLNIGAEIIKHIGNYTSFNPDPFKASEIGGGRQYGAWINNLVPGNQQVQAGGFLGIGMQYIQEFKPPMNQVGLYYTAKTYKECEYYLQYLKTKFVRFFLSCYYSKLTGVICKQCFKFVPSPMILDNSGNRVRGEFDHIYTDDELYKTWNIPQKYIEVIEAVVKERDPEIYETAYNEKAFKIFRRAKEVELNIRVKMQKILRENDINIQEYGYDLQMLKNSEDIKRCKDLVDNQLSLVDQFFQLNSLESSVDDLVNCFCRYPKMIQTWMKNKDIYKNGKFISIDSVLHEILVGYANFLDRNKWQLIKNKLKTYGIYSKQQIEMIVFMCNLVEILTSLQFNQDNLKVLQEQGVSSGDNQLGESEYSVVYKLS